MATFNEDVEIVDHDLTLENGSGDRIVRLASNGRVEIRRSVGGVFSDVLSFDAAVARLEVGAAGQ